MEWDKATVRTKNKFFKTVRVRIIKYEFLQVLL